MIYDCTKIKTLLNKQSRKYSKSSYASKKFILVN